MFKKVGGKVGKNSKKVEKRWIFLSLKLINSKRNFSIINIYHKLTALQNKNEFSFKIIIIFIFANVKFSLFDTSIAL